MAPIIADPEPALELAVSYKLDPHCSVPQAALAAAMQYVLAERCEQQPIQDADPKIAALRLKKDRDQIAKAYAALQRGYTINADGSLTITGSTGTLYTIGTNGVCHSGNLLCNGWKAAQKTRSSCYHVWAMELLLTAQAFEH